MKRFEYKIVMSSRSRWWRTGAALADAHLELLNREGRSGWRLVPTHQPGPVPWNAMLLERELD